MASINDLATLAQVKAWVQGAPQSADDALLGALITSASQAILTYLQRSSVIAQTYTDTFDGYGEAAKMLRHWPVLSVTSLSIGNSTVQAGSQTQGGYFIQPWDGFLPGGPQMLKLRYWEFCWGVQNVVVVYSAGYQISNEAQTIPATAAYSVTLAQPNGPLAKIASVVSAAGTVFTATTSSTPAAGQYQLDPATLGKLNFNSADANTALLITYSYVPAGINQACCEWVSEVYRYRTRVGERTHSVPGQQTMSFDLSRMTVAIRSMLDPFRNVVPIL